jgi:serine/threonine-protein kinase RsbW
MPTSRTMSKPGKGRPSGVTHRRSAFLLRLAPAFGGGSRARGVGGGWAGKIVFVGAQSQRSEPGSKVRLDLWVPPSHSAVAHVRQSFRELALPPASLDDALQLVTELVTNSIRHAGLGSDDRIRVLAVLSNGRLRVDVIDRAEATVPQPVAGAIRPTPGAESGWGLYLVDRLASRWGRGRGRYWFELECQDPPESPGA